MNYKLIFVFILASAVARATGSCGVSADNAEILVLNDDNFQSNIDKHCTLLVAFYVPWCKPCMNLGATYQNAAQRLHDKRSTIKLAKMDVGQSNQIVKQYHLQTYPTLMLFRNGLPITYKGNLQFPDVEAWIKKKTQPVKNLNNVDDFKHFLKENAIATIGFIKDESSEAIEVLTATAMTLDNMRFGLTNNDALLEEYNATNGDIVLLKPFDERQSVFTDELTVPNLKQFLLLNSQPLIFNYHKEMEQIIFDDAERTYLALFLSGADKMYDKLVNLLKELSRRFRKNVRFVIIDCDVQAHSQIMAYFHVRPDDVPTFRLFKLSTDVISYRFKNTNFCIDNIESVLKQFSEGKLKEMTHYHSQMLPIDWNKHAVKELVAYNFDEVALNADKHVLVTFYSPTCPACHEFMAIYEQLAKKYKHIDDIVIAKIDITANELEEFNVVSYPYIKLFRKGDNKIIDYELGRNFEDLDKFLQAKGDLEKQVAEAEETLKCERGKHELPLKTISDDNPFDRFKFKPKKVVSDATPKDEL